MCRSLEQRLLFLTALCSQALRFRLMTSAKPWSSPSLPSRPTSRSTYTKRQISNICASAYRSNPGTPTQVRRPDFIGVSEQQQLQQPKYYEAHPQQQAQQHQQSGYSPQRRFLSEGELVRQANEQPYARANNTVDNIRELAGSPQRSVYTWKDSSPSSGYPPPGVGGPSVAALAAAHQQHQASMVSWAPQHFSSYAFLKQILRLIFDFHVW